MEAMREFLVYFGVWFFGASCGFIVGAVWGAYKGIEASFEDDDIMPDLDEEPMK
jgi:hypothetical protein